MLKKGSPLKFEQAISRLEKMAEDLETGDLPLEESIKVFEEGMKLVTLCEEKLTEAEGKVTTLMKDRSGKRKEVSADEGAETDGGSDDISF